MEDLLSDESRRAGRSVCHSTKAGIYFLIRFWVPAGVYPDGNRGGDARLRQILFSIYPRQRFPHFAKNRLARERGISMGYERVTDNFFCLLR
jgi:hypothetical protein